MVELAELRSATLADGVENSLLDYIRHSGLTSGDLLPKEEELAKQLKVSRHILREGVSRLKSLGLLESRKHKGMILKRPNVFSGVSKLAEAKLFSESECREFMQIRVYMELGMAGTIFRKKTAEALEELRLLAGPRGKQPSMEEEIAFHYKLASIGGNAISGEFLKILIPAFSYVFQEGAGKEITPFHMDLCDALEKSEEDFRNTLEAHFKAYIKNN